MQLKASTDYALRAVIYLAMEGDVVSSKRIAEDIAVPRDYLIQLSQLLRNAGIIEARAGKNGGYVLAKDPSEISFFDVMSAIDENVRPAKGGTLIPEMTSQTAPATPVVSGLRAALDFASSSFDAYLDSITITTLAERAKDASCAKSGFGSGDIAEGRRLEAHSVAQDGFYPEKDLTAQICVHRSGKPQELHGKQDDGQQSNRAHQRPHQHLAHAL